MLSRITNCMVKPLKLSKAMKTFFLCGWFRILQKLALTTNAGFDYCTGTLVHLLILSNLVTMTSLETKVSKSGITARW